MDCRASLAVTGNCSQQRHFSLLLKVCVRYRAGFGKLPWTDQLDATVEVITAADPSGGA